jgi:hypothetical protein
MPNIYARYPDVEPVSRRRLESNFFFIYYLSLLLNNLIIAHMKGTHDQVKDKVCGVCGKFFSYDSDVPRHISKVHQDGKAKKSRRKK